MKNEHEVFREVLEELGFSNRKPNQMTNSDYWLCTCKAMRKYAAIHSLKSYRKGIEKGKNDGWDEAVDHYNQAGYL